MNVESEKISCEPIEISIRNNIGKIVSPKELHKIPELIENLEINSKTIRDDIIDIRSKTVFNLNNSSLIGAKFIKEKLDS